MRLLIVNLFALSLLLAASTAHAVALRVEADATTVNLGDPVTVSVFLEYPTAEVNATGILILTSQVGHDASAVFQSGSTPDGLYCQGSNIFNPCINGAPKLSGGGGDAQPISPTATQPGAFLSTSPVLVDTESEFVGSITFQMTALGTYDFSTEFGTGQGLFDFSNTNISGTVTLNTVSVNVIPEPTTALLMGIGLLGLGVAGRR